MEIVIVGGGLAAASAVEELRRQGHLGSITLIGAEPHLPYERPPLSKGVLLGHDSPDSVFVHDQQWYDEQQVEVRTATEVTDIDLDRQHVRAGVEDIPYQRLLLATGARPRRLSMADEAGIQASYLRTIEDSANLRAGFSGSVLVIGAGWIGLEAAAAARQAGADVTVIERSAQPLQGVLGPRLGAVFAELHREHGVDLRLETGVDSIRRTDNRAVTVRLTDGHEVRADTVVVGIGVQPNDDLARRAGLGTRDGVLVDATLRATEPHVFAAGDVARHDHPVLGSIRVEHWDTAIQQGRAAARAMLGHDLPYRQMPYFFTDQYDLGMEYLGSIGPDGYDDLVVRGDETARVLTAFWLRGSTVLAGMHLNDWDAMDPIRALVGSKVSVAALRDSAVPLKELTSSST
jgi:3-phenylpropionate/trans-cinnamate dioxygenase ferredoxin reductase component